MMNPRHEFTPEERRKGGKTTAERYGREHMSHIGQMGRMATSERHYEGDVEAMMRDLRARAQAPTDWDERLQCFVRRVPPLPLE